MVTKKELKHDGFNSFLIFLFRLSRVFLQYPPIVLTIFPMITRITAFNNKEDTLEPN